jgi:hypothetical protein
MQLWHLADIRDKCEEPRRGGVLIMRFTLLALTAGRSRSGPMTRLLHDIERAHHAMNGCRGEHARHALAVLRLMG